MKVSSVTPSADASDPKHPDHDRWVKDWTLKMEVDHAKAVGLPLAHAEAENLRMLERSERIARDAPTPPPKSKPAVVTPAMKHGARDRRVQRGVTTKAAAPDVPIHQLSPCGRCGVCRNCMRERRVVLIVQKRKEGAMLQALADRIFLSAFAASGRSGKFKGMAKHDIDRALTREAESVCDASVRWLGEWR